MREIDLYGDDCELPDPDEELVRQEARRKREGRPFVDWREIYAGRAVLSAEAVEYFEKKRLEAARAGW